jgi:hypothetical protein
MNNASKQNLYANNVRSSIEKSRKILPNIAAVQRNNVPLKGLAFREATKIIKKTESCDFKEESVNSFKSQSMDSNYFSQSYNFRLPEINNRYNINNNNKHKMNQREIFKCLHRGLASSTSKLFIEKYTRMTSLKSNPSLASFQ